MKVHGEFRAVLITERHGLVCAESIQCRLYLFFHNLNIIQATGLTGALTERVCGSLGVGAVGVERAAILDKYNVIVMVGFSAVVARVSGCVRVVHGKLSSGHKAVRGNELVYAPGYLPPT